MQIKNVSLSTDSFASSVTAAPTPSTIADNASSLLADDTSTINIVTEHTDSDKLARTLLSVSTDPEEKHVLFSILPPAKPQYDDDDDKKNSDGMLARAALDVCCVIDVSGSMSSEALIPADPATGGTAESTGLSVLDVVKHALRTIASTLQPDDRLALVAFNDRAKVVSTLTPMTDEGRDNILDSIKSLYPSGSTNLWDGLKVGMDLLTGSPDSTAAKKTETPSNDSRKSAFTSFFKKKEVPTRKHAFTPGRLSSLFILTDGMPNVNPPRGHIPMLKAYLDKLDNQSPFSISTFGFGYSLDTQLLLEIAQVGGGGYGFIPDSGIVGTVFVHAVANAFATYALRARLDVELPEGTTVQARGDLPVTQTSWGVQIEIGDIQFGQSLDVVLACNPMITNEVTATLSYQPVTAKEGGEWKAQATLLQTVDDLATVRYHAARLEFVEILKAVDEKQRLKSEKALTDLANKIVASPVLGKNADALALAKDISGEGVLALGTANYNRWGKHYLPSLARSHQRQQCANFKDPGLQVYGRNSKVFIEERDKLDAAFMALPPPEPSIPVNTGRYGGRSGGNSAPRKKLNSMSMYNNSSGPCFAGSCVVELKDGGVIKVEDLRTGMEVRTLKGTGEVAVVLRTAISGGKVEMCQIGKLRVTAWHPIVLPGSSKWVFPTDVVKPETMECDAIYSVLLSPPRVDDADAHSVLVAGVWCVTLGHGLTTTAGAGGKEDVRVHGFLGDYQAVSLDLARLEGVQGVVNCVGTKRDENGMICGFVGLRERMAPQERFVCGTEKGKVLVTLPVVFV